MSARKLTRKLIDIGANLTDPMYRGSYHGSQKHRDDFDELLQRAKEANVTKMIVTGGSLKDSLFALELAKKHGGVLFSTVGCHPTRCNEFETDGDPDNYLQGLKTLAMDNVGTVVAVGECGLDYDRLEFCPKEVQKTYFERQFEISDATGLPLFLHCRNAATDLVDILRKNRDRFRTGVVHSFDGTEQDVRSILDLDLFIGINGCSLKNTENLDVLKQIPVDRIMIETDCPWCEIRPSHQSHRYVKTNLPSKKKEKWESGFMVKGRNEPCNIVQVLEVVAAVKEEDVDRMADVIYETTSKMFFAEQ